MRKANDSSSLAAPIAPGPSKDEHSGSLYIAKSRALLTRFEIVKERVRCAMRDRDAYPHAHSRPVAHCDRRHPMFGAAHVHHDARLRNIQSVQLSRIGSLRGRKG
jgi:hypothetical protein